MIKKRIIFAFVTTFLLIVVLSAYFSSFLVGIVATWLTAFGTINAVILALWQSQKAERRAIEEKDRLNRDTTMLIDTILASKADYLIGIKLQRDNMPNSTEPYNKALFIIECEKNQFVKRLEDYSDELVSLSRTFGNNLNSNSIAKAATILTMIQNAKLSFYNALEAIGDFRCQEITDTELTKALDYDIQIISKSLELIDEGLHRTSPKSR